MSTPPDEPQEPAAGPTPEPGPAAAAETPAPKAKSHALRNVSLVVLGLFVAVVAGFAIGRSGEPTPTGQVSATSQALPTPSPPSPAAPSTAPSPKPSPSAAASPSPSPKPTVLIDFQGTGIGTSDPFNAPNQWKLTYDYQCTPGEGMGVEIELYQGDNLVKALINDVGNTGGATLLVDLGGSNLHLLIHSQCSWHVKATT